MKRIIFFLIVLVVALLPFSLTQNLYADEGYEFHRIMCANELNYFLMTKVDISNQGAYIWPLESKDAWKHHIKNLKALENKYGLYVLDDAYGYFDNDSISCSLNGFHKIDIKIEYDKATRPPGSVGGDQPYKSNPRLKINFNGKKLAAFNLNIRGTAYGDFIVDEVSVNDMDGLVQFIVCVVNDRSSIDGKYSRKCTGNTLNYLFDEAMFDNSKITAIMTEEANGANNKKK